MGPGKYLVPHDADNEVLEKMEVDDGSPCYWFGDGEGGVVPPDVSEGFFESNSVADFYIVFVASTQPLGKDGLMIFEESLAFMPPEGEGEKSKPRNRNIKSKLKKLKAKKEWFTYG